MHNQPKHEPMEASSFFPDGMSSRPMVAGTIARGQLMPPEMRFSGIDLEHQKSNVFPFEITKADLHRGKQRFEIYCAVCHGAAGDGDGMIVQRGFTKPPSFHEQRLREAPVGHFYHVVTNGWGAMYSYNDRVFPEDRWRIAAYIRVLQHAQSKAVVASSRIVAPSSSSSSSSSPTSNQQTDPVKGAVESVTKDQPKDAQQPQ